MTVRSNLDVPRVAAFLVVPSLVIVTLIRLTPTLLTESAPAALLTLLGYWLVGVKAVLVMRQKELADRGPDWHRATPGHHSQL